MVSSAAVLWSATYANALGVGLRKSYVNATNESDLFWVLPFIGSVNSQDTVQLDIQTIRARGSLNGFQD